MPTLKQFKRGSKLIHAQQRAKQKKARKIQRASKN
jgi:hypothetical protein